MAEYNSMLAFWIVFLLPFAVQGKVTFVLRLYLWYHSFPDSSLFIFNSKDKQSPGPGCSKTD